MKGIFVKPPLFIPTVVNKWPYKYLRSIYGNLLQIGKLYGHKRVHRPSGSLYRIRYIGYTCVQCGKVRYALNSPDICLVCKVYNKEDL